MKRSVKFTLKFSNVNKQCSLDKLFLEYSDVVNSFLTTIFNKKELTEDYIKSFNTRLSYRYKQCAKRQAYKIFKCWCRNKKKGELPVFKGAMVLDERFVELQKSKTSFDYWIKISTLNIGKPIVVPIKSYEYAKKYLNSWTLIKGAKLLKNDKGWQVSIAFEKLTPAIKTTGDVIGVDIGIKKLMVDSNKNRYGLRIESLLNKIQRKVRGSKAYKRALRERDYYINKTVKELPFSRCKTIVLENIKNIKKNTKKEKKLNKKFRSKFQSWTYSKLLSRIRLLSEVVGVQCPGVPPAYTSQTCPECKFVYKLNRRGETFTCRNCGYTADADYVGSVNVLKTYLAQQSMVAGNIKSNVCLQNY